MPRPQNISNVRSFLSAYEHLKKFIKRFYKITKPLHELAHPHIRFEWIELH